MKTGPAMSKEVRAAIRDMSDYTSAITLARALRELVGSAPAEIVSDYCKTTTRMAYAARVYRMFREHDMAGYTLKCPSCDVTITVGGLPHPQAGVRSERVAER